ncbi:MAG: NAD-dependent epimerase/dehydratase family protein [Holosporaceae bacterium]|jgi:nucleoside-diphosphate-sugar epimerase|nr:NAD-dependent epimerase/dehydratase family protein [Holosporaceae bacterium]
MIKSGKSGSGFMNILMIGGTKFIGLEVARQLSEAGHIVTLFHRSHAKSLPYPQIKGDCNNSDALKDCIDNINPDCIIHMTAMEKSHIVSLESALSQRMRVIIISSADVYKAFEVIHRRSDAPIQEVPLCETSPVRDVRYFYRSSGNNYEKIDVENASRESALIEPVILRLGMVFGKNDPYRRFQSIIDKMQNNHEITLPANVSTWRTCYGGVKNIAHGIVLAAEKGKSKEVYNLADKETFTELEWYHKFAYSLNWNGKIKVTQEDNSDYNYDQHLIMDTSKIRFELGFEEIYTAEEHLHEIVKNMKCP